MKLQVAITRHINKTLKKKALEKNVFIDDVQIVKVKLLTPDRFINNISKIDHHLVFTSVKSLLAIKQILSENDFQISMPIYCIKGKTADFAEKMGLKIISTAKTSMSLAKKILADGISQVTHFTSNIRLTDWQIFLQERNVTYTAIEVYHKEKIKHKWNHIDGVAFFSPSQVEAFLECNNLSSETPIFCIGETTGDFIKSLGYHHIFIPSKSSEEDLIEEILLYKKNNI
jgi:uroporphyrinogen-III synthase|tara:strand:- start:817 stop:1503 length:687 start_codon:yes stop_codon:yes gene_type:complete